MKFEKVQCFQPKVPVRPASPVRPVTPVEPLGLVSSSKNTSWYPHVKETNNNYNRCNKLSDGYRPITPIQPFDTLPASIPRIEIDKVTNNAFSSGNHCNTTSTFYGSFLFSSIFLIASINFASFLTSVINSSALCQSVISNPNISFLQLYHNLYRQFCFLLKSLIKNQQN